MLREIIAKELTFAELRERSSSYRALQSTKSAFVKATSCSSWSEAKERFPHHALEEKLKNFSHLSFKGGIPTVFKEYCRAAMLSLETSQFQVDSNTSATFFLEGYGVFVLKSENVFSEIGGITRRQLKDFTGASLIFAIVGEVSDGYMYVPYVYIYTIIYNSAYTVSL